MEVCCTHCGCNDVEILSDPESIAPLPTASVQGQSWVNPGRAKCNHCGKSFTWTESEEEKSERTRPLTYELHCPECDSINTRKSSSPKAKGDFKTRYWKCENGHNFKTNDRINIR